MELQADKDFINSNFYVFVRNKKNSKEKVTRRNL